MNAKIVMQVASQIVVGIFTPFVLQNLWNWFVVPAFNLHEILYWQMFGIFLFARVLLFQYDSGNDLNWQKALALLHDSVPNENREMARDRITEINERAWRIGLKKSFTEILLDTFALALGWSVHVFLSLGN